MQIAARTAVYNPDQYPIGRIVFLAEADNSSSAQIIEFHIIETSLLEFPNLQGAIIDLTVRTGELPKVIIGNKIIAYFGGEAAHFHRNNAAAHYIELCQEAKQEAKTAQPEQV